MNLIKRETCVITGDNELEHLYTFKNFPIFMGCVEHSISDDKKTDMKWCIGKKSGVIQLEELIPLDILYYDSHGAGIVGDLWNKHHISFANFINEFDPDDVFEIGGSHGKLATEYSKIKHIPWTILDPNPVVGFGDNFKFIKGFFDENFKHDNSFGAIVHSHLFEHIYNPHDFVKHLSNFINDGKYLIFSIPNLEIMLEQQYTNCINFEHTFFLTSPYVKYLLESHGFRIVKTELFLKDHSVFYAAIKDNSIVSVDLPQGLYNINKKLFQNYIEFHENLVQNFNTKMSTTNQNIYLFGAHVFSQYLIQFGLNISHISYILDNDTNKQGKRLYGQSLMVKSPEFLRNDISPIVILSSGVYNDEIKKQILENINPNTIFWT